jgi:hypothetical protein
MTTQTAELRDGRGELLVGGYAALAESAWMGAAQATDVLEPLRITPAALRVPRLRLPRVRLAGLLTREFSIAEATVILMASFFTSAMLGAIRQVLFNAEFGAGSEANAYYAAFRLPDTLFSLIAGGALSSAMIPVLLSTASEEGDEASLRLVNLVMTLLLAVFASVVLIGQLLAPVFVNNILAPGFDAETSDLTVNLTRIMLLQPVILAVGSVATAVLNGRNQPQRCAYRRHRGCARLPRPRHLRPNPWRCRWGHPAGADPHAGHRRRRYVAASGLGPQELASGRSRAAADPERARGRRWLCRLYPRHLVRVEGE